MEVARTTETSVTIRLSGDTLHNTIFVGLTTHVALCTQEHANLSRHLVLITCSRADWNVYDVQLTVHRDKFL